MSKNRIFAPLFVVVFLAGVYLPAARSQQLSSFDRDKALTILDEVAKDVQKNYYDPNLHGVDWKATVLKVKQQINTSSDFNLALAHIAAALMSLNDSHTFYLPPSRPYKHSYCYQSEMIGDRCFVTQVRPGSDAAAKGLKPGDQVLSLDGYGIDRETQWQMEYGYNVLRPEPGLRLILRDVKGQRRQLDVMAKIKPLQLTRDLTGLGWAQLMHEYEAEEYLGNAHWNQVGDDLGILKLPSFNFDHEKVTEMIKLARKRPALILDLRGNPGGSVETLKFLLGGIFEKEVKIGERVGRKKSKTESSLSGGGGVFTGKLAFLVDSKSASAAELFARVVQLEKRGVVLGDRSEGAVMEANIFDHKYGLNTVFFYGAEITVGDIIMGDGKSLEHAGVTPDELLLPTAADLDSGRDPVLSRAAALLGAKLTPEAAGKMFPYQWPKD